MATERIWTVAADGLEDDGVTATDYSDPQLWDDAEAYDAVTADEIPVLEFFSHASGVFSGSGTLLTINGGWTTDSTRYIWLRSRADQRHEGKPPANYQYTATNNAEFVRVGSDSVLIDGLSFQTNNSAANFTSFALLTDGDNVWLDGCFIAWNNHGGNGSEVIQVNDRTINVYVRNCISVDKVGTLDRHIVMRDQTTGTYRVYNNTLIGGEVGIDGKGFTLGGSEFIKNNIVQDATTDYSLSGSAITAKNFSSDATSPDGASFQNVSLTFNDAANDDYHLDPSADTAVIGEGEDLTTEFEAFPHGTSVDIDKEARPTGAGTWDAGADQIVGSAAEADLAAVLPAVTGSLSGSQANADLAAVLPAVTGSLSGSQENADLAAVLSAVAGSLSGSQANADLAAGLPAVGGSLMASLNEASLAAGLPALTAGLTAAQEDANLAGNLPAVTGNLTATQVEAALSAIMPALTGAFATGATAAFAANLPALIGALNAIAPAEAGLAGPLPATAGAFASAAPGAGALSAELPAVTAVLSMAAAGSVAFSGVLPAMIGTLTAIQQAALSRRERAFRALLAVLQGIAGPDALRDDGRLRQIPAGGLITLRDGPPGLPQGLLWPVTYLHRVEAEILVQAQDADPAARNELLDDLLQAVETAVAADRSLGGVVDHTELSLDGREAEPVEGGAAIASATVLAEIQYESATALG